MFIEFITASQDEESKKRAEFKLDHIDQKTIDDYNIISKLPNDILNKVFKSTSIENLINFAVHADRNCSNITKLEKIIKKGTFYPETNTEIELLKKLKPYNIKLNTSELFKNVINGEKELIEKKLEDNERKGNIALDSSKGIFTLSLFLLTASAFWSMADKKHKDAESYLFYSSIAGFGLTGLIFISVLAKSFIDPCIYSHSYKRKKELHEIQNNLTEDEKKAIEDFVELIENTDPEHKEIMLNQLNRTFAAIEASFPEKLDQIKDIVKKLNDRSPEDDIEAGTSIFHASRSLRNPLISKGKRGYHSIINSDEPREDRPIG